MRCEGMAYRLQSGFVEGQHLPEDGFDPLFWARASHLSFLGVELCVARGAVKVDLVQDRPHGKPALLTSLDCPFPGSSFSPPLSVHELVASGGRLRPVLRHVAQDAEYDLCFATNDPPATPRLRVAFLLPGDLGAQTARAFVEAFSAFREARLLPGCHAAMLLVTGHTAAALGSPLPAGVASAGASGSGWWRQATYDVAHGPHTVTDITHVATLSPRHLPGPETFSRAAAVALYLREEALLHKEPDNTGLWPESLADLRQLLRHGLPRASFSGYLTRLERGGVARLAPGGSPPALPTLDRVTRLRQRLAAPRPANPDPALTRLRLQTATQLRQRDHATAVAEDRLKRRLEEAGLWDTEKVRADLDRANRTMLSLLRDRHQGERAVIVGNGPSLKVDDLNRLCNLVTFGSNKIYLAYEETRWRPTYYSVEDHLVLQNNLEQIQTLSGSVKIFPASTRNFGYHAGDTVFVPFLPPTSFESPLSDPEFPAFSRDLSHGIAWGSTIVYSQIQMALYMGCSEIILIGVDHSYQTPPERHGNQYISSGEQNHFHPEYRTPGEAWHQPNLKVLDVSYAKARAVCENANVRVLNASRESALTIFERADFDDLFPLQETPA